MANPSPIIFTNAYFAFATSTGAVTIDFSNHVQAIRLTFSADEQDDTVMGLTSHSRVQGLFSWTGEVDLLQDFESTGATAVDAKFFDLLNNKIKFNMAIRPFNAARSSDNPEYNGLVRVFQHNPLQGAVGDLLKITVPLMSAGNLNRTVTSS